MDSAFDEVLAWIEEQKYASDGDPLLEEHLRSYIEAAVARYAALGDRARLERLVIAVLSAGSKVSHVTKKKLAAIATDLEMTRAVPALRTALAPWANEDRPHYACQNAFYALGAALARLSPGERILGAPAG